MASRGKTGSGHLAGASAGSRRGTSRPPPKHPGMTWHDHLVMLLQTGAEIEHAVMVEYLYAAYSLGGEQVPERHRAMVKRWRDSLMAIAREEMGHLLAVQNILKFVGGAPQLDRSNPPWDSPYLPFPFRLEPLSLDSLACYVFAEMPAPGSIRAPSGRRLPARFRRFTTREEKRILASVGRRAGGRQHRIGLIYEEIIDLISDPERIPDAAFDQDSLAAQASWDEWGRNYRPDPVQLTATGDRPGDDAAPAHRPSERRAHVLVPRVATRAEAIEALRAISGQGEAMHLRRHDTGEPSHFERFLEIYQELEKVKGWNPARDIPVNPVVPAPGAKRRGTTPIRGAEAREWATLFNLRYRMLLTYIAHALRMPAPAGATRPQLRAMTMHKAFGEMYALSTIAAIVVRVPLDDARPGRGGARRRGPAFAGPPFEMPDSLALPDAERDAWRLHRELLAAAEPLVARLRGPGHDAEGRRFAETLADIDRQTAAWLDRIISGAAEPARHGADA